MPRRDDIESILVIGSGPIVIGQACEFDYSGTQACRVLAEEGYRVVLANSNPATIMTDPGTADRTYVEPLDPEVLAAIIERERPDALLPTLGGQTALNLTMAPRWNRGALERASRSSAPGRRRSARPRTASCSSWRCRRSGSRSHGPASPTRSTRRWRSPTRSGTRSWSGRASSSAAGDRHRPYARGVRRRDRHGDWIGLAPEGLDASPVGEILVERSIAGWKEYELEVMRDNADNCVVVCSIENLDPMGVHTGDSITVAPAQTLTDVEYQAMRDDAFACLRRVGVETGGSNVQFAVDPATARRLVIEMNPRVSRSSALASKATGFPIAKIAARLAVGYRLDEITNDITRATPASFEPTIDYVVTKIPRWAFEKLPGRRGPARHAHAVGRRGHGDRPDLPRVAAEGGPLARAGPDRAERRPGRGRCRRPRRRRAVDRAAVPTPERLFQVESALAARGVGRRARWPSGPASTRGSSPDRRISEERRLEAARSPRSRRRRRDAGVGGLDRARLAPGQAARASPTPSSRTCSASAASDGEQACGRPGWRPACGPTFKTVDTCGAEFEAVHAVPLLHLRGRGGGPPVRPAAGRHPRVRARTGSARGSSSTTAASTPAWRCGRPATRR